MEPKPSRLPRRITVQPSPSSPISARMLRTGRLGSHSETYRLRDSSLRHDSDFQDSSPLRTSSRDWSFRERDSLEHSWKTPSTYQRCSGTYDLPLSGSYLANRSRISTAASSSQPSWYDPLERSPSTYSGLHSQQQDWDSKRPKLSYSGRTPLSGVRSTTSSYTSSPDTSSRYGRFPRTSVKLNADLVSERERERRTDTSSHGLLDYGHRSSDSTPSYLQDRVSSYAQGARPKENSLSTVRLNTTPISRQLPSQSSSLLRDSSRSSRSVTSRDLRSPQRDSTLDFRHTSNRNEGTTRTSSGRVSPAPRSTSEQNTDTEGRRTTRHLLSRLASSMSSTFFSRRSSQDSLSGRSTEAEEAHSSLQNASPQPVATTPAITDTPETRPSEQPQGFAFLRRRRWGLSSVSPNQSSDSDAESYRSEDSETRTSGSWLPSSLRNRCTPLFSRRRREGREEPFRAASTSDSSRMHNLFRRASQDDSLDEVHTVQGAGAAADNPSPLSPDSLSGSAQAASLAESLFSRRNSGISGMLPNSFLHFSVPASLGSSLSDNVMITVDIVPSGRTSDGQESEKTESSRDPEKLKKIQESLLLEDSEEEDGDLCRICQTGVTTPTNPFIEPCKCSGSLQYVHQDCMKKWLHAKINSGSSLETITTCELCKEKLDLNLEDFDIQELYRAHANERAEYEFISSGLYLVVLLHLCEQRFSDMLGAANEANTRVRFINLARTLQAHMEDLETSEDDSEDERV